MTQNLLDYQAADDSVLACAVFLTEQIKHPDGHAEAIESLVPIFLAKKDVDTAAQLADSIRNDFVRDKLLVKVADKSAEIEDYEYATQLSEAIEDNLFQEEAREKIAIQQSEKGNLEDALQLAKTVSHNSVSLATIAAKFYLIGDENRALEIFGAIEEPAIEIDFLQNLALEFNKNGQTEKSLNLLERAFQESENIEIIEEKARSRQNLADTYAEIGRKDKAIEVLAKAQNVAEKIEGVHRNSLLSQISVGFLKAGSLELADRTLDLINDKTVIAATLTHYAENYYERGETDEAFEILEEAAAILKSQHERETRNSQEKYTVLGAIAAQFAQFEKYERALEIALENPSEKERFSALQKIARFAATNDREDFARNIVREITDESEKLKTLLLLSDAEVKKESNEKALEFLREVYEEGKAVGAPSSKIEILNFAAIRFHNLGEIETAREILRENISEVSKIYDESIRATMLGTIGEIYEKSGYELTQKESEILLELLRKSEKF